MGGAEVQTHNTANKLIEIGNEVDILNLKKEDISNKKYNILELNKFIINIVFLFKYYFNIDLSFFLKVYFKKFA